MVNWPFTERKMGRGEVELLRALLKLANQLQSNLEVDAVVRVIAAAASETFGFGEAGVMVREEGDDLRTVAVVGGDGPIDLDSLDVGVPSRSVERLFTDEHRIGHCYFVAGDDPDWERTGLRPLAARGPFAKGAWRRGDTLLVPLRSQEGRLRGLIRLGSPVDGERPSLATVHLLGVFATHAVVAIENALEHQQLQRVSDELEEQLRVRRDLTEMSRTLLAKLDQQAVFDEIARVLGQLVPYKVMAIALEEKGAGGLVPVFATVAEGQVMVESGEVLSHAALDAVLRDGRPLHLEGDDEERLPLPFQSADAPATLILAPLATSDKVFGVLGIGRDRTERFDARELELTVLFANLAAIAVQNARTYREMQHLAVSDGLTGIHNYRHFRETLAAEVRRAERYGETFCLMMMDLDHFKAVNDTIGHQQGDEVLRDVAAVLQHCCRESDYLARYGGEEFVMILPRTTVSEARHVAERVRVRVRDIDAGSPALRVSISIGVASYPDSVGDMDGVLRAADAALLRAKASGRDRIQLHGKQTADAPEVPSEDVEIARVFCETIGLDERQTGGVVLTLAAARSSRGSASDGGAEEGNDATVHGIGVRWDERRAGDDAFAVLLYSTERWDGRGYPEGLVGEEIPLAARVFAVCRRYLEALDDDPEGALERLWRAAGHELDPHLVQRFTVQVRRREADGRAAARPSA